jgi:hypothetical protein
MRKLVLSIIIGLIGSLGFAQERVIIDTKYEKIEYIDDKTANSKEYFAWALIGTAYNAARWKIMRITYTGNTYVVEFADGNTNYDNTLSNYPTLTYS